MKNLKKHGCQKQVVVTILKILYNNSINYLLQKIGSLLSEDIKGKFKINLTSIWQNNYKENDFQERHTHAGSHFLLLFLKKLMNQERFF